MGLATALCPAGLVGDVEKWHQVGWDTETRSHGRCRGRPHGRRWVMKFNVAQCKVMQKGQREPRWALNMLRVLGEAPGLEGKPHVRGCQEGKSARRRARVPSVRLGVSKQGQGLWKARPKESCVRWHRVASKWLGCPSRRERTDQGFSSWKRGSPGGCGVCRLWATWRREIGNGPRQGLDPSQSPGLTQRGKSHPLACTEPIQGHFQEQKGHL